MEGCKEEGAEGCKEGGLGIKKEGGGGIWLLDFLPNLQVKQLQQ